MKKKITKLCHQVDFKNIKRLGVIVTDCFNTLDDQDPLQQTWELLVIAHSYFLFSQASLMLEDIYVLAFVSEVVYGIDEQKILL